jgi:hypothetical protein
MPVDAQKNARRAPGTATRKVKFLRDTVHPDYGQIEKGEVLRVRRDYLDDYEELGIAEETDDDLSRDVITPEA